MVEGGKKVLFSMLFKEKGIMCVALLLKKIMMFPTIFLLSSVIFSKIQMQQALLILFIASSVIMK